jgi:hypothetical protein
MKLIFKNFDIEYENISFAKIKQNVIMEGTFTKIIYSDSFVTINGLYLLVPLIFNLSSVRSDKLRDLQERSVGKDQFSAACGGKLRDSHSLHSGDFSIAPASLLQTNETACHLHSLLVENEITNKYLYFYSYTPHNLLIIKKIAEMENRIINYYNEFYEVKKKVVLNLSNLLNIGRIRIYRDRDITNAQNSDIYIPSSYSNGVMETDADSVFNVFTETGSKTSINSPSLHSGELYGEKIEKYSQNVRVVLKISGVWETKHEIGLTYKFVEMYNSPSLHFGEFSITSRSSNVR